jgi:molybdopterin-guanine dinucleotide biosynthesis protein
LLVGGQGMSRLWRRVQRQPALFAGAVLVTMNLVLLSGEIQLSTQALGGINAAVAALLAFLVSLIGSGQLRSVHRRYVLRARDTPRAVVQSAGSMIGEVVGRDELCRVIMEDLRDPDSRRAHGVVGGVGTGKTALLVRLTKLLAERGVVPVPVRLRDAQQKLDFRELARVRFLADTDASLLSSADGERVWRQLCQDDKIVVLADGLEEALIEGDVETERDNLIRVAIDRANESRLPLVIASRPHDPLRGMAAAIVELEPLSEDAALEYVQGTDPSADEHRLDWIVKTAGIAESPLYLPITRQLHRMGFIGVQRFSGVVIRRE